MLLCLFWQENSDAKWTITHTLIHTSKQVIKTRQSLKNWWRHILFHQFQIDFNKKNSLHHLSKVVLSVDTHSVIGHSSVEDIKTKFRNLRTIFQREHKAVSSNKTCGSEDFYLPKWKHYRELMFLCESCDEDERPEDIHFHEPQESSLLHLDSQAPPSPLQYLTTNQTATILKAPPSPTPPDSQHSSPCSSPSPSTSSSHTDSRVSGRKRPNRRAPPTNSEMLDFMTTFCQSQMVSPHAGFLKYVEECLNETPPNKVKKLKKMIIETIHSVSEEV